MNKGEIYKQKIQKFTNQHLLDQWKKIDEKTIPDNEWAKGKALEYLILRAFEIGGADVTYPYTVYKNRIAIEQIDGVVYYEHYSCLIECKDYNEKNKIDFNPFAKMRSQLMRRPSSTIGCIFSVSGFTVPAIILAGYLAPQTILLWEKTEIEYVLKNNTICNALVEKYKKYIETCQPDYNTIK